MCYARLMRFFYDAGSGICKQFFFGGCRGNANNFLAESDCIEKCVRIDALPREAIQLQNITLGDFLDNFYTFSMLAVKLLKFEAVKFTNFFILLNCHPER